MPFWVCIFLKEPWVQDVDTRARRVKMALGQRYRKSKLYVVTGIARNPTFVKTPVIIKFR